MLFHWLTEGAWQNFRVVVTVNHIHHNNGKPLTNLEMRSRIKYRLTSPSWKIYPFFLPFSSRHLLILQSNGICMFDIFHNKLFSSKVMKIPDRTSSFFYSYFDFVWVGE